MLAYTKAAGKKILRDISIFALVCSVITQLFYIFYLIYAILNTVGIFEVNLIMLVLSCAYFGFFLHSLNFGKKKKLAATVAKAFKWSKRLIKLLNLGIMIYGIVYTATEPDALSIILTAVMGVLWLSDILLEVAVNVMKSWWDLFVEGIQADMEIVTKPADAAKNFFKKVTGQEVEQPAPPTKKRLLLNRLVEKAEVEKKDKELEEKYLKQEEKAKKKNRKKKERQARKEAKKAAKSNPAPSISSEVAASQDDK